MYRIREAEPLIYRTLIAVQEIFAENWQMTYTLCAAEAYLYQLQAPIVADHWSIMYTLRAADRFILSMG
ncbi:hypothetical protein AVEN_236647-1, partial [Araneus ventricosus]